MEYGRFLSDVDTAPLTIRYKCSSCQKVEQRRIVAEERGDYAKNEDGTYTDLFSGECFSCMTGKKSESENT